MLVALAGALSALAVAAAVMAPEPEPPRTAGPAPAASVSPVPGSSPDFELRPDLTAGSHRLVRVTARRRWLRSGGLARARVDHRRRDVSDRDGGVFGAVVSERVVAAVLPGGRRLPARRDPRVPAPLKLILGEVAREPAAGRALRRRERARAVTDVDPRELVDASLARYPTRRSDLERAVPDAGPRAVPGALDQRHVQHPRGRDDVVRPSFLSCATAVVYSGKVRLRAAILLEPTRRATRRRCSRAWPQSPPGSSRPGA